MYDLFKGGYISAMDCKFKRLNIIGILIPKRILSKSKEQIQQYLSTISFQKKFQPKKLQQVWHERKNDYRWLHMQGIKNSEIYHKIVEKLGQSYPNASYFYIWNSDLSTEFFIKLFWGKWTIRALYLHNCSLGYRLGERLSLLSLEKLQQLSIKVDPFDNKALKQLIPILPTNNKLKLQFSMTNITSDGLKLLKKIVNGKISFINISNHYRFNYNTILKQIGHLKSRFEPNNNKKGFQIKLISFCLEVKERFIYLGSGAKMQIDGRITEDTYIMYEKKLIQDWRGDMLTPKIMTYTLSGLFLYRLQ